MGSHVRVVVIEGNIGAGKTTVLHTLAEMGYKIFEEPVGLWQPLLELQQTDRKRWTFTLQMYALAYFIELQKIIPNIDAGDVKDGLIFVERCAASSKVFTKTAYEDGMLQDLEFLVWDSIYSLSSVAPDTVFFLKAPIETCLERIRRRGRRGEESLDYNRISLLERNYDEIYKNIPKTIVDASLDASRVAKDILVQLGV